jgi:hypothetical protein
MSVNKSHVRLDFQLAVFTYGFYVALSHTTSIQWDSKSQTPTPQKEN